MSNPHPLLVQIELSGAVATFGASTALLGLGMVMQPGDASMLHTSPQVKTSMSPCAKTTRSITPCRLRSKASLASSDRIKCNYNNVKQDESKCKWHHESSLLQACDPKMINMQGQKNGR